MSQPKDRPTSFIIFQIFCGGLFAIFLSMAFGLIYGPMNLPMSIFMGFGGSFLLHSVFEKQINYAYWWLRVWWDLNVRNNDS
jgi:hypothetical protein